MTDCDLASYMKLADKILADERTRFTTYLTWDKIDKKIEAEFQQEILVKYQTALFQQNNALTKLFVEEKTEDLALLFKLYQPV